MKTCPRCSEICSNKSNFCSNCGYAFGDLDREPERIPVPPVPTGNDADSVKTDPEISERKSDLPIPDEEPVLTIPSEPELPSEPEIYIELVRIADDEAIITPSEIYIDNDYVGVVEYNSRKKFPVPYGKHIVVIETGEQRRTRQFDNTRSEPVQVYRYTVRPHNAYGKSYEPEKKKHTFAKIICTLLVLLAAAAFFLPKDIFGKVVPSGVQDRFSAWGNTLSGREAAATSDSEDADNLDEIQDELPDSSASDSAPAPLNSPSPEADTAITETDSPNAEGYGKIFDEYAEKLRAATPGLIEEFNKESAANTGGVTGLAELSSAKISRLSEISNEGIDEMADYMWVHGSGDYAEYSQWADKLKAVFDEESQKITDNSLAAGVESLGS